MDSERRDRQRGFTGSPAYLTGYAGLGLELAGGIIGFLALGWWVDYQFGTGKVGLIAGAILGCVGGMYNFIRQAIELNRRQMELSKREQESARGEQSERHD